MCGIAGFYNLKLDRAEEKFPGIIQSIKQRGPDADGVYYNEEAGVGLFHTRLSIIDTSSLANQPFTSSNKRYTLVFNGEIYNYKELYTEYLGDVDLKTTSDTEILVELFARYREKCFEWLNGMFALAIYDHTEDVVFLARDRVGEKPLYYYWQNNAFVFGSELKAINQVLQKKFTFNRSALPLYLQLGYFPEPHTIYEEVYKFPSGSFGIVHRTTLRIEKFWSLEAASGAQLLRDENLIIEKTKKILNDSVKLRLQADVPFGIFLSGGIDSSLVASIAVKQTSEQIKTFSIGITESKYNEAEYAAAVAKTLQTDHHEFKVSQAELRELLPTIADVYDEPIVDGSVVPTMMVSRLASKYVKMVLTGDGGDETFLGYGAYKWAKKLDNPFTWHTRYLLAELLAMGNNRMKRVAKIFQIPNKKMMASHIFSQEQYLFDPMEIYGLTRSRISEYYTDEQSPDFYNAVQQQAFDDIQHYLKDDLLVKVDRATMRYHIEARCPLLDHRLVELSQTIDPAIKMKGGEYKYILKKILFEYLPESLFNRPKWGFSIPLAIWLKEDYTHYKEKYILPLSNNPLFDSVAVCKLSDQFEKDPDLYYNKIWSLILLQQVFEKNNFES
jgi:asparagine synthase (glutamine-hydrolysing)